VEAAHTQAAETDELTTISEGLGEMAGGALVMDAAALAAAATGGQRKRSRSQVHQHGIKTMGFEVTLSELGSARGVSERKMRRVVPVASKLAADRNVTLPDEVKLRARLDSQYTARHQRDAVIWTMRACSVDRLSVSAVDG
jgi:hypothetical protein